MMSDDVSGSPNPHRLYRNKRKGAVAGVCAGLADYFGGDVTLWRIGMVLALVFATPIALAGYVIAAVFVPPRPEPGPRLSPDEERFWRGVSRRPEATFSNLKYRFRDLDERLADIERVVTSEEWRLRRQFKEIE